MHSARRPGIPRSGAIGTGDLLSLAPSPAARGWIYALVDLKPAFVTHSPAPECRSSRAAAEVCGAPAPRILYIALSHVRLYVYRYSPIVREKSPAFSPFSRSRSGLRIYGRAGLPGDCLSNAPGDVWTARVPGLVAGPRVASASVNSRGALSEYCGRVYNAGRAAGISLTQLRARERHPRGPFPRATPRTRRELYFSRD